MTKAQLEQQPDGKWMIRDPRTGRWVEVRGFGAMESSPLPLIDGIDLTKPIFEQVAEGDMPAARKAAGKS